jgi:hypothetical protein
MENEAKRWDREDREQFEDRLRRKPQIADLPLPEGTDTNDPIEAWAVQMFVDAKDGAYEAEIDISSLQESGLPDWAIADIIEAVKPYVLSEIQTQMHWLTRLEDWRRDFYRKEATVLEQPVNDAKRLGIQPDDSQAKPSKWTGEK